MVGCKYSKGLTGVVKKKYQLLGNFEQVCETFCFKRLPQIFHKNQVQ